MTAWLAALALLAQSPLALAGDYQTQQVEVGAALQLNPDGTFQYRLDYVAVSEAAQGHWTAADGQVRLTSEPLPPELVREIERSDAGFDGEALAVEDGALVLQRHDTRFTFYREEP